MKSNRRKFIGDLGMAGIATITVPSIFANFNPEAGLNILVLGGTNFLGPAIVKSLLKGGHEVTLFNRGVTNPHLFKDLTRIIGDREKGVSGYTNLKNHNGRWDIVIDVWPQHPKFVKDAIAVIKKRTMHYIFISSIAAYNHYIKIGMDESSPRRKGTNYEPGNYNLNKVLCEKVVEENFPDNFTILRPGAIVGDRDSGPFGTYVLNRIANRKEILAPDSNDPVQFIDAQDIGNFVNKCAESSIKGHFNVVGPASTMGYKEFLTRAKDALKSDVKIIWMDVKFLVAEMKLEPFMQIPFWIPVALDPEPGFQQISNKKAINVGLKFTDYKKTVEISYDSFKEKRFIVEEDYEVVFGISDKRENEIIEMWKKRP
ncbi:MAG: NAD-dependent epimerase/dehydratase family protein [Aurantibacter sp.]